MNICSISVRLPLNIVCCVIGDDCVSFYNKFLGADYISGMMLRMFTYLYDLEIVEEEVFMKWKEDINEEFPGKGKALFQVSSEPLS